MNISNPGRGLAVSFRKKCGEIGEKNNNFYCVFLTSFCGECGELFIFTAFPVFLLPYTGSDLLPPACRQLLIPQRQLSITSMILLVNLNIRWKKMRRIFVRNAVKLAVNFLMKGDEMQ